MKSRVTLTRTDGSTRTLNFAKSFIFLTNGGRRRKITSLLLSSRHRGPALTCSFLKTCPRARHEVLGLVLQSQQDFIQSNNNTAKSEPGVRVGAKPPLPQVCFAAAAREQTAGPWRRAHPPTPGLQQVAAGPPGWAWGRARLSSSARASQYCAGQSLGSWLWTLATNLSTFILLVSRLVRGPHWNS